MTYGRGDRAKQQDEAWNNRGGGLELSFPRIVGNLIFESVPVLHRRGCKSGSSFSSVAQPSLGGTLATFAYKRRDIEGSTHWPWREDSRTCKADVGMAFMDGTCLRGVPCGTFWSFS